MKIVMISPSFWPAVGGVERHVLKLSEELMKNNHQVTVVSPKAKDYKNVKVKSFSEEGLKIWLFFLKNKKLFKEADVIHCHDYITFLWYLPLRFLMPKKKVFVTFHGWEGKFPPDYKTKLLRKVTEKLVRGNICIGQFIEKWYGQKADLISYGAVDSPPSIPTPEKKNKGVFIGRLEKDTGIREYFKALKILKEKNVDFKLTIYGDGSLKKELQEFAKNHALSVDFRGRQEKPWEEAKDAYWAFVAGYLAILEAMSWKKAIISVYDNELKKDYLLPFDKRIKICSQAEEIAEVIINKEEFDLESNWDYSKDLSWNNLAQQYLKLWEKPRS